MSVGFSQSEVGTFDDGAKTIVIGVPTLDVVLDTSSANAAPYAIHEFDTAVATDTLTYDKFVSRDGGGQAEVSIAVDGTVTLTPSVLNVKPYGTFALIYKINGGLSRTVYYHYTNEGDVESNFSWGTLDSDGWTILQPETTSRLLYVDPTLGNNATAGPDGDGSTYYTINADSTALPNQGAWEAPGAVNAYETLAAALAEQRNNNHDWILFKRGETIPHSGEASLKSGTSGTQRATYTAYGTGAKPIINQTLSSSANLFRGFSDDHITIAHLELTASFRDPDHVDWVGYTGANTCGSGIAFYTGDTADGGATTKANILIEGCKISHFLDNINSNGSDGIENFVIRRNYLYRSWNQDPGHSIGLFLTNCHALIEDNVFEHNGWTQPSVLIDDTSTSGTTTTVTLTGAGWTTDEWTGARIYNLTDSTSQYGNITSNTSDTITYTTGNALPDFTGGGDNFQVGGGGSVSHGQATIFSHNVYLVGMKDTIFRRNITAYSSSIGMKLTSNPRFDEGTHTGGTHATVLTDSSRGPVQIPWVVDSLIGQVITNPDDTPESNGTITSNTSNTITCSGGLTGGTNNDWRLGDRYDIDTTDTGATNNGYSTEQASTEIWNWSPARRQRVENFVEHDNFYLDNEIGGGFGGNDDYDNGYRWLDMRFVNSFFYKIGESRPTGRTIAHAQAIDDANGAMMSGNIHTKYGASPQTNCIGLQIIGHLKDVGINRNVFYDIGDASGTSQGAGAVLFKTSETPNFTSFDFIGNYLQMANTDAPLIVDYPTAQTKAGLVFKDTKYYSDRAGATQAEMDGTPTTIAAWVAETGETGYTTTEITFNAIRTIETYQTSVGGTATLAAFVTDAAASRDNTVAWDTDYDLEYVMQYMRDGYREA